MSNKLRDSLHALDERRVAWVRRTGARWRALPKGTRTGVFLAFLAFLFLLPVLEPPILTTPGADFDSILFYPVAITVLVAIGLNVVVGQAGLLDLGYVAFFAVGAYTVGVLGSEHGDLPWLICVPIGVVVAMISGFLLGSPTLRLRGDYLAIVTLGFGEIVRIIAQNTEWLGGADGISNMPRPPDIGPLEFNVLDSTPYYWLALVVIIFVVFLMRRLEHSRVGRAWTAIREDEDAAELMGVPTFKYKLWAFAIGAAVGGLSGTLYAGYVPAVTPDTFQLILSILFLAAVVLGGAGNLPGVILGGVIVAYLPERLRDAKILGVEFKTEWRVFIFGVALIVMMIFRPQGILPSRQRAIELTEPEAHTDFIGLAGADIDAPLDPCRAGIPDARTMTKLLELDAVQMRFGGVTALDDVSFHVDQGEILGLIGPNGAGKTTVFNVVTGVYRPTAGVVRFDGRTLRKERRSDITRLGIARTFQNIRLFPVMTALENVMVAADAHNRSSVGGALVRVGRFQREEQNSYDKAMELLAFMKLERRKDEYAKNLPYGDQRRLEIARAMATDPKLLCLDEPAAGFNPAEKQSLMELIRTIRGRGYTVLLIEHDMSLVMGVTDRIAVLDFGRKIADGSPEEVRTNPDVIQAYLGAPADASKVRDLNVFYGRIHAIKGLSVEVEEGKIVTLIGANGAGKTTTMKAISGVRPVASGSVWFDGRDITRVPGYQRVDMGLCPAPEGRGIFPGMSVMENLEMGCYARKDRKSAAKDQDLERVLHLFPRLKERFKQSGGTLSGGEQMLAIGRALMARPRLLLLDEPSMGLAPMLIQQIFTIVREINAQGTTVLLVEQNASQALRLAEKAYVLETGRVVKEGSGDQLLHDQSVIAAYLGG